MKYVIYIYITHALSKLWREARWEGFFVVCEWRHWFLNLKVGTIASTSTIWLKSKDVMKKTYSYLGSYHSSHQMHRWLLVMLNTGRAATASWLWNIIQTGLFLYPAAPVLWKLRNTAKSIKFHSTCPSSCWRKFYPVCRHFFSPKFHQNECAENLSCKVFFYVVPLKVSWRER